MSRESTFRWIADGKVRDAVLPEISDCARRIEALAEQMLAGENPEINKQRLDEIIDACVATRCYADKLS